MIYFHLIFSDNKKAVGYAWNLMGFVAKLAQGVRDDRLSSLRHSSHILYILSSLDFVSDHKFTLASPACNPL